MDDQELRALESPDAWDSENAELHPGTKNTRSVISIAFARDDYARVSKCAAQLNKRTSEFIREAALEKVNRYQKPATLIALSGNLSLFRRTPVASTRLSMTAASYLQGNAITT